MSDFKLRWSDVFRYIVLGAVQASLCYMAFGEKELDYISDTFGDVITDQIVIFVIALSIFYLSGFLTQMVIQLFCKGNLMGTGLSETGLFINKFPTCLLNRSKYPHWLYYSERPDKVLGIYKEIMAVGEDSDVKTEYLYANNLFQGIALSLVVFSGFDYSHVITLWNVVLSISAVLILCVLGTLTVKLKWKWMLLINRGMALIVPLTIWITYYVSGKPESGALIGVSVLLCLCIAEQLSRLHIRRIDVLIKYGSGGENEKLFLSTLKRNGLPGAFILTRVSDSVYDYYPEQLESIKSQIYPNIKAIVLIDRNSSRYDAFVKIIDEYRRNGLDISHYTSEGSGPACLAYEIRDIFLNYAGKNDVAISLDGDDLFASCHVVARIMGRMARTGANICLLTFAFFGDTRLNFAKNYPNEIVRKIAEESTERGKALTSDELINREKAYLISTIGWTKCYTREVLSQYQRMLDAYADDMGEYSKYEDFPDIAALLNKSSRICAVGRTSILFRKHPGSITTDVTRDNYDKHITYYLGLSKKLSCGNQLLADGAYDLIIRKFIPYKFIQYLNIVLKKTSGNEKEIPNYSAREFFELFTSTVYGGEKNEMKILREGMMEIIHENHELTKMNHTGYYGKDIPSTLKKDEIAYEEIVSAYDLEVDQSELPVGESD